MIQCDSVASALYSGMRGGDRGIPGSSWACLPCDHGGGQQRDPVCLKQSGGEVVLRPPYMHRGVYMPALPRVNTYIHACILYTRIDKMRWRATQEDT